VSNSKDIPITVTFRHLAPTEALRSHAEKKLAGLAGQVPGATDVHVVLEISPHHHRQAAEITVHADGHHVLQAHHETEDLYQSIDGAVAKLQSQVRTLRGKVIDTPRREGSDRRRGGA
jgi:putative sigma-54 modulation protein